MRSALVLAVLGVLGSSVARADRGVVLGITAGGALVGGAQAPDRLDSLIGATLAWQKPIPQLPALGTATAQAQLVPELGLIAMDDRGAAMAGLRLQLDVAQHGMGLFHVSARMSVWLSGKVGLLRDADGPIYGGDFGELFEVGSGGWQVGGVFGVYSWREPQAAYPVPVAGTVFFRPGDPGTQQFAATFALVVAH